MVNPNKEITLQQLSMMLLMIISNIRLRQCKTVGRSWCWSMRNHTSLMLEHPLDFPPRLCWPRTSDSSEWLFIESRSLDNVKDNWIRPCLTYRTCVCVLSKHICISSNRCLSFKRENACLCMCWLHSRLFLFSRSLVHRAWKNTFANFLKQWNSMCVWVVVFLGRWEKETTFNLEHAAKGGGVTLPSI